MQRILSKIEFSKETVLISLLWGFFAFAIPTKVGNFDFRHFDDEEGLTLSISRSAPPMAILEDERLPNVPLEPIQEIKRTKGSIVIVAGQSQAWSRLKYYSRLFEKKMKAKAALKVAGGKKNIHSNSKLSDLINLVKFIPSEDQKIPQVYAINFNQPAKKYLQNMRQSVREDVERPLLAPPVPRSLPTGEEAPPQKKYIAPAMEAVTVRPALEADPNTQAAVPAAVPGAFQEYVTTPSKKNNSTVASLTVPVSPRTPAPILSNPSAPTKVAYQLPPLHQAGDQVVSTDSVTHLYKMSGQVELSGGLVATGSSTKLDIQWHSGSQTRVGVVDYSTGQFLIEVPSLGSGKISARLFDESGSVLGSGEYELEDNDPNLQAGMQSLQGITILVEPQDVEIRGQVVSAYNVGQVVVPVLNAEVFGPSQAQDVAEKNGTFNLSGLGPNSTFVLEAYAQEHWGTRIFTSAKRQVHIPVFPYKMMESFFSLVGADQDGADYGVIWGSVKRKGNPVSGVQVKLVGAENIQPVYFNELRIPDRHLASTTSNGLFAFTKVKPGINIVRAGLGTQELPSTIVSVSASHISYSEILFKSLEVQGSIFDPTINLKIENASVSVIGSSRSTISNMQGFSLKVPSSDPILIVEAKPGEEYFSSREIISSSESKSLQINVFKKEWLKEKLKTANVTLRDTDSFVIGSIRGPGFHVQLDDPVDPSQRAEKAEPQILYFNEKGALDPNLLYSVNGTFIMVNIRPGLHTLVIQPEGGESSTTRLFAADPGVASIISLH